MNLQKMPVYYYQLLSIDLDFYYDSNKLGVTSVSNLQSIDMLHAIM